MKLLFSYIAQEHQTPHSLPIALEILKKFPDIEIHIACTTLKHLEYIKSLVSSYLEDYSNNKIHYYILQLPQLIRNYILNYGTNAALKLLTLYYNKKYFNLFDAIIVPERTSLYLKTMSVVKPKLIWTRHGAGDRAVGFAKNTKDFDFILMSGKKIEQRLLENGSIKPGQYQTGIYAKFDLIEKINKHPFKLFNNNRPIVLYNPHFKKSLSSWHRFGHKILEQFIQQDRYNLIFAPHYRLFDPPIAEKYNSFSRYQNIPHILLDLGSTHSIDMTYTKTADVYLGDVSSQITEFLVKPRPCIFLNAHHVIWKKNPNYISWTLGKVVSSSHNILKVIDNSFITQKNFIQLQKDYIRDTFGIMNGSTATIGADAIVNYLKRT